MQVAIFQSYGESDSKVLSPTERFGKLEAVLTDAKHQTLDLLVCQELFMSGYNVGDILIDVAEEIAGSYMQKVMTLAKDTQTAIVYGYPEKHEGKLYNSAVCISSTGEVLANHRKLMIPPGFEREYFETGDSYTFFTLNSVRCSILICYDAEFPESVRAVAEAGTELVIVPTALVEQWESVALQLMPTRAFENGVWVMYANHAGTENGFKYAGKSCILDPVGRDVARANLTESVITATIDTTQVKSAQERLPYLKEVKQLSNITLKPDF